MKHADPDPKVKRKYQTWFSGAPEGIAAFFGTIGEMFTDAYDEFGPKIIFVWLFFCSIVACFVTIIMDSDAHTVHPHGEFWISLGFLGFSIVAWIVAWGLEKDT